MNMDVLKWIEGWYLSNCNEDWEHSYGITIETLDNPGWDVKIDLKETPLENKNIEYSFNKSSENDWYSYKIQNNEFVATGDPNKLTFLLELFRNIVEESVAK